MSRHNRLSSQDDHRKRREFPHCADRVPMTLSCSEGTMIAKTASTILSIAVAVAAGAVFAADERSPAELTDDLLGILKNQCQGEFEATPYGHLIIVSAPETKLDRRVSAALEQRVTVSFEDTPVAEAIDLLHRMTAVNVVVMPAVRASGATVTLQVRDMKLANVLTWMATLANCHVQPMHEAICFSDQALPGATVTKVYDVSDQVMPVQDFPGPELAFGSDAKNGFTLFAAGK
jgi:hypothetical protein